MTLLLLQFGLRATSKKGGEKLHFIYCSCSLSWRPKKKENKKKPTKKSEEKLHALKQGLVLTLLISFFFGQQSRHANKDRMLARE